jgi:N4-(beta-N-acetylglucosaminyl)-L-asparaginase
MHRVSRRTAMGYGLFAMGLASPQLLHHSASAADARSDARSESESEKPATGARPARPVAISSQNGLPTVTRTVERMNQGIDPLEAIVEGIAIVEDDPDDTSVGYGGLPNERGVVQLDASVMHGPTHRAGAVAALENIRNPARVAWLVMQRTDHVLLVGKGALDFAKAHGFKEENLLTDRAREAWLRWRAALNRSDNWLEPDQYTDQDATPIRSKDDIPFTEGTIHCSAVDTNGDIGACTSTSGLSWKIPGRVGDSPIIGAGNYADNLVGAAGATGRGEAVIQSCGSFQVVQHMANGDHPTEACLKVLKWITNRTRRKMLLNERGEPNFNVVLYAVRRDGAYGSACMRKGREFAVHDGTEARLEPCAHLFE